MRPVQTSGPAATELSEAVRWYESRRSGLGGELFDKTVATISLIRANPEIGTTVSRDGRTRRVLIPGFPYQVIYRLGPNDIVIVAIAHLKRRPGYWQNRS